MPRRCRQRYADAADAAEGADKMLPALMPLIAGDAGIADVHCHHIDAASYAGQDDTLRH